MFRGSPLAQRRERVRDAPHPSPPWMLQRLSIVDSRSPTVAEVHTRRADVEVAVAGSIF
jgi:hypothetical protein